jgi:methionyl-tRNA synthetase
MLDKGFPDVAITRPSVKWGISVPWNESETVYVWPDALTNYLTGVGYGTDSDQFQEFWPADAHIVGKDIAKFHAIIWPSILLAAGLPLPKAVMVHGFFTLNGQKISKSLGNIIDPNEWVEKYSADAVRYFLMREVPFINDGDVSEEKLKTRYESELANGLGNLVSRVTNMIEKYGDGVVDATAEPHDALDEVGIFIENYRFHDALAKIFESIAWANQYIDETKPWELAKTDLPGVNKILAKLVAQIHVINYKLAPFIPETAEKIRLALENESIVKIEPLFPRIEESKE